MRPPLTYVLVLVRPSVDFALDFFFCFTILFLQLTYELFPVSGNLVKVVVGKFAPILLSFALKLLPVTFDLVPIHHLFLSRCFRIDKRQVGRKVPIFLFFWN